MARGELRIYLGAAPGVGKTYAMLDEGRRRAERGTDVVVGALDTHGRPATQAQLGRLEVLGDGGLSADAVVERNPQLVLVDELALSDLTPEGERLPRHRAVARLLDAGIDVITTVDIGQLESLGEIVHGITGIAPGPLVPDRVVRTADQIHLVDQTPEALRRRLAHGNIFPPDQVGPDVANAFRTESLAALRELTLSWMANRVDEQVVRPPGDPGDPGWETREVVVVALTGAPSSEHVIRRAARLAERQRARLIGVHVRSVEAVGASGASPTLDLQRRLIAGLGGEYREVASGDVAAALIDLATSEGATQLVVGTPKRSRWIELSRGSLINDVLQQSPVDVHVVSSNGRYEPAAGHSTARLPRSASTTFSPRRQAWSWVIAVAAPALFAVVLTLLDHSLGLSAQLLVMVLGVTSVAVVGGARPATLAAALAFVLSNWFFIPPLHQLSITSSEDAVSLAVFLVVALAVGTYVSRSAQRSAESLRARSDASTLAAMAGAVASSEDPLPALVERLREVYEARGAALYFASPSGPTLVASAGDAPTSAESADQSLPVGRDCQLLLAGGVFRAVDRSTSTAFLDQLAVAVEQRALRADREEAKAAASTNELRAALLAAVSHDLRTPLSSVKVAVSTLRQPTDWPDDVRSELLEAIEDGTDRLAGLITNLLDMSRIQAGAVDLRLAEVRVDEVVARAALALPPRGIDIRFDLDDRLPSVHADAALLGHIVSNLMDNATKWSPPGGTVVVDAREIGDRLHLRIIDQGPGIPASMREQVRKPFQRHDDSGSVEGTGLGLAVADGFARLMGFDLVLDDTPGGGTTATLVMSVSGSTDA